MILPCEGIFFPFESLLSFEETWGRFLFHLILASHDSFAFTPIYAGTLNNFTLTYIYLYLSSVA